MPGQQSSVNLQPQSVTFEHLKPHLVSMTCSIQLVYVGSCRKNAKYNCTEKWDPKVPTIIGTKKLWCLNSENITRNTS